jgi:recombination protein RecR
MDLTTLSKEKFLDLRMNFSSILLENAVTEFSRLPGIGSKTALRLVLHLLNQDKEEVIRFADSLQKLREEIRLCEICQNLSDHSICAICNNQKRNQEVICVVEDTRDVMAIENTGQFQGLYHVLGGLISPMDGIGPQNLHIEALRERLLQKPAQEIIFALSATMEGDTTLFYLYRKLKDLVPIISTLAKGIAFGGELEYVDEVTLGRSIMTRVPYETSIHKSTS